MNKQCGLDEHQVYEETRICKDEAYKLQQLSFPEVYPQFS
jgi:hypothetical protein